MARHVLLRATLVVLAVLAALLLASSDVAHAKRSKKSATVVSGADKIAELSSSVRDGVVTLTADNFDKFVLRPDRPYHLFLLFTATADKYSCDVCKYVPLYLVDPLAHDAVRAYPVDLTLLHS